MKTPCHFFNIAGCITAFLFVIISASSFAQGKENIPIHNYLDSANFDFTVKPGDDFFMYANGTWLKNNPIPASEVWWGDAKISENDNFKKIKALLEDASSSSPSDKMEKLIGAMYKSGMDTSVINKLGISPAKPDIDRIATIKTPAELLTEIAYEQTLPIAAAFTFDVEPDLKNSTKEMPYFFQGGLGLPEKSYYFNMDNDSKKIREDYLQYINKLLVLTGMPQANADKASINILALETTLAKVSKSPDELRDIDGNYNKYSLATLKKIIPGISWSAVLKGLRISPDSVIVAQPDFFNGLATQLMQTDINTWKSYLQFHFVDNMAIYLSKDIEHAHYEFDEKTLNGRKVPLQRWDQVSRVIDGSMGDPLGYVYVKKYFPPAAKARMDTLVTNIELAFEERIEKLDWMSDATRQKAIIKLHAIVRKIGYPDKWKSYEGVVLYPSTYYKNEVACNKYLYDELISKLGKKVDRKEWGMTPPTVNAEYNPSLNTIEFPAGILQYPFFALDADDAVNYGGIGLVIGHELTHGFDDQGRQFDENGNRNNWWTADDEKRFNQKAAKIIALYSSYTVLDTMHVNGSLTQGENIADFGGLAISFDAFKKTRQYKAGKKINGFTPVQRYFLAFAQCRRRQLTPKFLKTFVQTDPHAPSWFRIIGPYSNFTPFYETYSLQPGDKMYRPEVDRISIW